MKIQYSLSEEDMITHQLYLASTSERIMKERIIAKVAVPIMYVLVAIWYYFDNQIGLSVTILMLIPLWYFLYPLWERKRYKSHYKSFIKEHFSTKVGRPSSLEFDNVVMILKDDGTETKILTTEIAEIVELPNIILIKLITGESLVISQNGAEHPGVKQELKTLASALSIEYRDDRNWRWK